MPPNDVAIASFFENVLNAGQIDRTGDYFWDDVVEEVPFPGQGPGLEGLKDVLGMLRAAFPDALWTVEEQVASNDKVVTRFTLSGTHDGPFMGVPASGRKIATWGMVIDAFEGGKVRSTRLIMDALGLMMQIGAIPPPSAS